MEQLRQLLLSAANLAASLPGSEHNDEYVSFSRDVESSIKSLHSTRGESLTLLPSNDLPMCFYKQIKGLMSHASQSFDARFAEVSDVVLSIDAPHANVRVEDIVSVLEEMARHSAVETTTITHAATLAYSATVGASSSAKSVDKPPTTFVVVHISNAAVARAVVALMQVLQATSTEFASFGRVGWVARSVVEDHCHACASTTSVLIDPPSTKLETMLSAKRCQATRKRPLNGENGDDAAEDELSCIVLYLAALPRRVEASLAAAVEQQSTGGQTEVLAAMERIASEGRWPIVEHYLDVVKQRFFLKCSSTSDAAKVRELFISVAKSGSVPILQGAVTTASMKVCSPRDMSLASSAGA